MTSQIINQELLNEIDKFFNDTVEAENRRDKITEPASSLMKLDKCE